MAITFVNAWNARSAGDNSRADITDADTSACDFFAAVMTDFGSSAATAISDSLTASWTTGAESVTGGGTRTRIAWTKPGSVGAGHDFAQVGAGNNYCNLTVLGFAGVHATPFDQANGAASGGASTLQPGSITPTEDDELVIFGGGFVASCTISVTGYSTVYQMDFAGGVAFGGFGCYLIQTSAGATNPTASASAGSPLNSVRIASFKKAAGGGGGGAFPHHYYQQMRRRQQFARKGSIYVPSQYVAKAA